MSVCWCPGAVDTTLAPVFAIQLGVEQFFGITLDVGVQFQPPKSTTTPPDPFVGEALVDFSSTVELVSVQFFADAALTTPLSITGVSSGLGFNHDALQDLSAVPLPMTGALVLLGLVLLIGWRRWKPESFHPQER